MKPESAIFWWKWACLAKCERNAWKSGSILRRSSPRRKRHSAADGIGPRCPISGCIYQFGKNNQHASHLGCHLFELYAQRDVSRSITAFANAHYVAGQDLTRDRPSRARSLLLPGSPRSYAVGRREALPNLPPLEARLGLRLHEPCDDPRWGVEAAARVVDDQGRVAQTLFESPASGFTIWDVRAYWRVRPNMLLIGGVENLGDKFYREHLDSLAGRGVFQPGASYYIGSEITY